MTVRTILTILPLTVTLLGDVAPRLATAAAPDAELSVRITSPLGRTGLPERIRIVAQVRTPENTELRPIRFYVDDVLLGEDAEGPPYAIEWTDENPFEPRDIVVEARDTSGRIARDSVHLKAIEVVEAAEVSGVLLDVSVHDRAGVFVKGLKAPNFQVREDGAAQTLDLVRVEAMPATYTLLIDTSQSMGRRIDFVREAAAGLVRQLRPDDRVVVAPFSREVGPITGPSTDRQTLTEAMESLQARGGTAILNALEIISKHLVGRDGRHAVVLLTDGYDEHSTTARDAALQAIKSLRATLYVVGIAGSAGMSLRGEQFLRRLAAETGGRAFFPSRESELPWVHQRLAEEVQRRYLIGYTPKNQQVDGTWRSIEVTASDPSWLIRTRPGYFAPKPPPIRPSVEFTVLNAQREFVDLTRDDVIVREDGVEQTVDTFQEAVAPVSIVVALDSSGSMKKDASGAQAAARTFVQALRPEDRLAFLTFADRVWFAHDLTTERAWALDAIDQYTASGGTALYDAAAAALTRLKREQGRRVVVLVTDGRDEDNPGTGPGSTRTFADLLTLLDETDATVFAVGLGAKADTRVLEQLAAKSGGEAYFPQDASMLGQHYARIVENLRRRYIVSYTSTNAKRDGRWRHVELTSRVPDVTLRTKGGYVAPER
ncbi:MAG: VWA domain-containing protein [Vicinamibacterales bacterium]